MSGAGRGGHRTGHSRPASHAADSEDLRPSVPRRPARLGPRGPGDSAQSSPHSDPAAPHSSYAGQRGKVTAVPGSPDTRPGRKRDKPKAPGQRRTALRSSPPARRGHSHAAAAGNAALAGRSRGEERVALCAVSRSRLLVLQRYDRNSLADNPNSIKTYRPSMLKLSPN